MILFSSIIQQFDKEFLAQYDNQILPSIRKALGVMKICRSKYSLRMLAQCGECEHQTYMPHSCGHRNCPHCQAHGSSRPSMAFTAFRLLPIRVNNGWNDNSKNTYLPSIIY